MTAFTAEIIGSFMLILLGNGVVANVVLNKTKGHESGWMVITTAWALAVFTGVVIAAPYSGAHLNPAVSIGLATAGLFEWSLVPSYILAQFIGAMLGSFMVSVMYRDHYSQTPEPGLKLVTFCTKPAILNRPINLISEVIGTFVLIFAIFHFTDPIIANQSQTSVGMGSLGALPVAFIVWVIGLSLGGTTGYAINPARDLGPRIVHALLPLKGKGSNEWHYAWIPSVGPVIGAVLAAVLYLLLSA